MDVSIVIPLYNESESLIELNEWINKSLISSGFSYEIIYIDDVNYFIGKTLSLIHI